MLNKKFEKKHLLSKPGCFNFNVILQPRITQAQREKKLQQEIKKQIGPLTQKQIQQKNNSPYLFLESVLVQLNLANNLFHAKQIIKNKKITINNKIVNEPTYIVKPFSIINVKNKQIAFLNKIKKQTLKNPRNFINTNYAYKTDQS